MADEENEGNVKRNQELYKIAKGILKEVTINWGYNEDKYRNEMTKLYYKILEGQKVKYFSDFHNKLKILKPDLLFGSEENREAFFDRNVRKQLDSFIKLLYLIEKVDKEFYDKIEEYKDVQKGEFEYITIENELNNAIYDNSSNDSLITTFMLKIIEEVFQNKHKRKGKPVQFLYLTFYQLINGYISTYFEPLINVLANKLICDSIYDEDTVDAKNYIDEQFAINKPVQDYMDLKEEAIFLSYAYNDRFYSFLLFLEALSLNKFLFIDWMLNSETKIENKDTSSIKKDKAVRLKEKLKYFLDASSKLLLLRSLSSELHIYPRYEYETEFLMKQVRQWCSWEIGYFYNTKPHNMYRIIKREILVSSLPSEIKEKDNLFLYDLTKIKKISSI